eukprot:2227134-Prymnesium_polylepis.2
MGAEGPALAGPSTTHVPVTLGAREQQPMIRDQRGLARGDRHLLIMGDGDISGAGHIPPSQQQVRRTRRRSA